jgi:hypothetical protein
MAKLLQRKVLLVILVSEKRSCLSEISREDVFREPVSVRRAISRSPEPDYGMRSGLGSDQVLSVARVFTAFPLEATASCDEETAPVCPYFPQKGRPDAGCPLQCLFRTSPFRLRRWSDWDWRSNDQDVENPGRGFRISLELFCVTARP